MNIENLLREEVKLLKPYIPSDSIDDVKKKLGLSDVINLSSNESVLGSSEIVKEAIKSELNKIHRYPDSSSHNLRKMLASRFGIDKEMIIVTNGGDELINLLGTCFVSPEDELIMGEYGFATYHSTSELYGGKIIAVPFKDKTLDLANMADRVTKKTKIIFLCNPHNPNGTIFSHEQLREFLDSIPKDPIILLDEAYYDFVEDRDYPDSIRLIKEDNHNIIALRTFSKIGGMAGLRIGFGIAKNGLINCLKRVQPPYSVNNLAQVAAEAFLGDINFQKSLIQNNIKFKKYLYQEFARLNLSYIPTEANFIFVDVKQDADLICTKLMKKGIIVRSGKIWGCNTHIRVTIGTEVQSKQLINILETIL